MKNNGKKIRDLILGRIKEFIKAASMSESAFGIAVANNHRLIPRLREGKISLAGIEEIEKYLEKNGSESREAA